MVNLDRKGPVPIWVPWSFKSAVAPAGVEPEAAERAGAERAGAERAAMTRSMASYARVTVELTPCAELPKTMHWTAKAAMTTCSVEMGTIGWWAGLVTTT